MTYLQALGYVTVTIFLFRTALALLMCIGGKHDAEITVTPQKWVLMAGCFSLFALGIQIIFNHLNP